VEDRWEKVLAEKASEIVGADEVDPGSLELMSADMRPEAYIRELTVAEKWPDAVKVMTRALPPREAVWWACVCARQLQSLDGGSKEMSALEAAEKWVYKPTEKNRRKAFRLAQESEPDSAATLSALAAGFSAGNLPAAQDQHIDLESGVFSRIVDAVVMISAAEKSGDQVAAQFQRFLKSGENIACGGNGQLEGEDG
jgi:hypothetical protein